MIEMENFDVQGVEEYKKERLSNFLRIPQTFEKVFYLWKRHVLTLVNLVWMVCLFGFVFAYVHDTTVAGIKSYSYSSSESFS